MGQGPIPSGLFPPRVLTQEIPEWSSKRLGAHLGTLSGQSSGLGPAGTFLWMQEIQRPPKAQQEERCRQDQAQKFKRPSAKENEGPLISKRIKDFKMATAEHYI